MNQQTDDLFSEFGSNWGINTYTFVWGLFLFILFFNTEYLDAKQRSVLANGGFIK